MTREDYQRNGAVNGSTLSLLPQRPIAIDLFAGAGGLSLGFEQAGFDVVASVEYDPVHAAIHAYNFPQTVVLCRDVAELQADELRLAVINGLTTHGHSIDHWDGEVDIIFGGPPCQGFSTMGKRLIEDTRNQLVFHFFRIISQLRPRYFVMENVPGMAAGGHSSILEQLIIEFQDAGYIIAYPPRVLNAADFGVPQDRRRLILLGSRQDQPALQYPEPTVYPVPKRQPAPGTIQPQTFAMGGLPLPIGPTVWQAIGDLPNLDYFPELLKSDQLILPGEVVQKFEESASPYSSTLRGLTTDRTDFSYPRVWDRQILTSSLQTAHSALSVSRFAATKPGEVESVSRFYRLDPEGLCNTLRAGTGSERGAYTSPRPIHPVYHRTISVREGARLHSYPDWFRFHPTKWHGFRQVGNSVPPLFGRAIAQKIIEALQVLPSKPTQAIELGDKRLLSLDMSRAAELFAVSRETIPQPRRRQLA